MARQHHFENYLCCSAASVAESAKLRYAAKNGTFNAEGCKAQGFTMNLTDSIASLVQSENIELRRMLSDLTQENFRLKIALSEGINALNAARLKLEASTAPSPLREVANKEIPADAGSTSHEATKLSVIGSFPFRSLEVRMLSDGTLETDTPDGPLRFEDVDHLDEVFASKWPRYGSDIDIEGIFAERDVA